MFVLITNISTHDESYVLARLSQLLPFTQNVSHAVPGISDISRKHDCWVQVGSSAGLERSTVGRRGCADLHDGHDGAAVGVLAGQPGLQSARVLLAVDVPLPLQRQVILKVQQQVCARHGPPGEEVLRHPVILPIHLSSIRNLSRCP